MNLKPITPDRFTDSRLFIHETPDRKLLVKVFLGDDANQRKDLETKKMNHWKAAGFCVPGLIDLQFAEAGGPHVVMDFVVGDTLKHFLKDTAAVLDRRLATLAKLFELNYRRHLLARSRNDLLLIHSDPNTDNIILSGSDFCFIDFEHPSRETDCASATANEVGTFARRVIRDMGVEHGRMVIELLLAAYRCDREIFDKVEDLTFGRPFQPLHRMKDRLKRLGNSRSVTRYDVADCIRMLRATAMGQSAN